MHFRPLHDRVCGAAALNWLMFAMSYATIAWISLRTIGG
jgi:hypothetical protein